MSFQIEKVEGKKKREEHIEYSRIFNSACVTLGGTLFFGFRETEGVLDKSLD